MSANQYQDVTAMDVRSERQVLVDIERRLIATNALLAQLVADTSRMVELLTKEKVG